MNERIQELASQAKDYTKKFKKEMYSRGYYHDDLEEVYNKKFAELIVGECLTIAKTWEDSLEDAGMLDNSNAVGIVAYRISRQFGVKR